LAGNALAADKTWTFTTSQSGIKWLVTDHLGSTRMVIEETGSLAGIKRRDCTPFGEELGAGVGIRSAAIGYVDDGIRQKFGSKERDSETGFDFFASRYYSSYQGRFTKPDTFSGRGTNPQTLNLYAYVLNNPLRWADPTGHMPQDPKGNGKDKCGINYDCTPDENYDPNSVAETIVTSEPKPVSLGISVIPVYGNYCESCYHFKVGNPGRGTFYAGMAISDLWIVKSLVTGLGKLGLKLIGKEAVEETSERVVAETLIESGVDEGSTVLFRAVKEGELADIMAKDVYRIAPNASIEGKYFFEGAEDASGFAKKMFRVFPQEGPYTITSIRVPNSVLNSAERLYISGEGAAVVIPKSQLPLGPVKVWTHSPLAK
jgi:RHS repeat-associated protein